MGKTIHVYETGEATFTLFQKTLTDLLAARNLDGAVTVAPITADGIKHRRQLAHSNTIGLVMPARTDVQDYYDELGEEGLESIAWTTDQLGLSVFASGNAPQVLARDNPLRLTGDDASLQRNDNPYGLFQGFVTDTLKDLHKNGYHIADFPYMAKVTSVTYNLAPRVNKHSPKGYALYCDGGDYLLHSKDQKMVVLVDHDNSAQSLTQKDLRFKPDAVVEFAYGKGLVVFSNLRTEYDANAFEELFKDSAKATQAPAQFAKDKKRLQNSAPLNTMILDHFVENCLNNVRGKALNMPVISAKRLANA